MATTLIKTPESWDFNKSQFDEIDLYPMMSSPGPLCTILATYFLFVLKIGPSLMNGRKPLQLKSVLMIYNGLQVVLSLHMLCKYFMYLKEKGVVTTKCYMNNQSSRSEILSLIWLYFAAKVTELLDTVFFVLRKKYGQVTFLHVYHHSVMVAATWAFLKYSPADTAIYIGFVNSLVHVVMYTYYALAARCALFKKYITSFQLLQLVSMLVQWTASARYSECPPPRAVTLAFCANISLILLLFANFYWTSYTRPLAALPRPRPTATLD